MSARLPGSLPLLGHALRLRSDPLEFLTGAARHGDIVELRVGPAPVYLIGDPGLAQQVLLDSPTFDKGGPLYRELAGLLGDSLATSVRERHRGQRRMMQPSFQHSRMPGYAAVMTDEIDRMLSSFRPGQVVDLAAATRVMALRVVARALFASQLTDRAMRAVEEYLPLFSAGVYRRMTDPLGLLKRLPTPANRRFAQATAGLRGALARMIADCRTTGAATGCVMADLLAHRDEAGRPLAERELVDHAVVLFLAGAETSATAIAWAFHALTQHSQVERALHAELDTVPRPGLPELARLDYTRRFVLEVLRRYPPIWVLTRTAVTPAVLRGVPLAAGAAVVVSPYALHQNPAVFPDPARVDPDRWLPERASTIPRGAWLAFGAGSRKCIGDEFGTIETTLAIAAIASRWRLRAAESAAPVREIPATSLHPGPMPMRLEPRWPQRG